MTYLVRSKKEAVVGTAKVLSNVNALSSSKNAASVVVCLCLVVVVVVVVSENITV